MPKSNVITLALYNYLQLSYCDDLANRWANQV